jgi:predicted DNA-binding protein (MmcQ/YjbR family)
MSKKHWNTVKFHQDASDDFILQMVDESYNLVANSLPKKLRETINK